MSRKPLNYCRSCDQDFSSLAGFDRHRVGKHEYTYSEGLHMEPMREDGRRCLSTSELTSKGFQLDKHGRWYDLRKASKTRKWATSKQTGAS